MARWACVRNLGAKKASGASTLEYDGKFGMKSLNGLGGGGSLEGWAGTRSGCCFVRASSVRSASRTSPWQERGDAGCAAIRESLAEITGGDGVLVRTSDETCASSSAISWRMSEITGLDGVIA